MKLTLSGYSTALFSTWYFIEELGLLFDAGDGISSHLLSKSRKVKYAFISHADRDHVTGLLQLNQLNAREEYPKYYYPKDCGTFPALASFMTKFDPHIKPSPWLPISSNEEITIKKGYVVKTIRNGHIVAPPTKEKSFSFIVQHIKRKLKNEYKSLSGVEIGRLRQEKGEFAITDEVREDILGYSGDTPVEDYSRWENTKILIHEATFLNKTDVNDYEHRANRHSTLPEVIEMVAQLPKLEHLVLGHFSSRYSKDQINQALEKLIDHFQIKIPISLIYPSQFQKDILSTAF